ncbi:MAG: hypothetical protein ACRDF7_08935 [Candidatus Limnocylindrales bacterium]
MFVHDDRLLRGIHARRSLELHRAADARRGLTHQARGRPQSSLRRTLGRSMVRLGSRLAADPS